MSNAWRDPAFGCGLVALAGAVLALHVAHVIGGHRWFAVYSPVLGLLLTVAVMIGMRNLRRPPSIGMGAALLALLVVPEWLEGELTAGHSLEWTTLESHGGVTVAVLLLAGCAAMLWEAQRIIDLLRAR